MEDWAYSLLQPAINCGLDEFKFWDMTVAEVERYLEGARYREQHKAHYIYTLADLIGISSARMMSADVKYPSITEVFPTLFAETNEVKEIKEEINQQNSVNRFMEWALRHNAVIERRKANKHEL